MLKSKPIKITDVRIAVAKECIIYEDYSKETITRITKAYLAQIKKDHMEIQQWTYSKVPTVSINATKVQFEIDKLKNEKATNSHKFRKWMH